MRQSPNPQRSMNLHWNRGKQPDADGERALEEALQPWLHRPFDRTPSVRLSYTATRAIRMRADSLGFTLTQALFVRETALKRMWGMYKYSRLPGVSEQWTRYCANQFEAAGVRLLERYLPVTTEEQLRSKYRLEGRNGPTPDAVLDAPLSINGLRVHWIDFKNFYAEDAHRDQRWQPSGRLSATANKYNAAFGPGAFVFAHGFCPSLEEGCDALFLDARQMGIHTEPAVLPRKGRPRPAVDQSLLDGMQSVSLDAAARGEPPRPQTTPCSRAQSVASDRNLTEA